MPFFTLLAIINVPSPFLFYTFFRRVCSVPFGSAPLAFGESVVRESFRAAHARLATHELLRVDADAVQNARGGSRGARPIVRWFVRLITDRHAAVVVAVACYPRSTFVSAADGKDEGPVVGFDAAPRRAGRPGRTALHVQHGGHARGPLDEFRGDAVGEAERFHVTEVGGGGVSGRLVAARDADRR